MKLYVDGALVGTNDQTQAQDYSGFWRVGGDTSWGGDSPFFDGVIDEVAIYSRVLTASDVAAHFQAGGGQLANQSPQAAFTSGTTGRQVDFTSQSLDPDGTIADYAWDFGDGAQGTTATPAHTYATPGTYPVKLTVTDNRGGTDTITHDVTVTNARPTASFTDSEDLLKATVNGSGSSDPDGTIASYDWDWGDSTAHGSGATAVHTYASSGTRTVTLTVTDDNGATDAVTHDVTVTSNQAPSAVFTSSTADLTASVNSTGSNDPDGTIASYLWTWGDGTPDGAGATATHAYTTAGTYPVTLTVTDNRGSTDTATHNVTVTAPAVPTNLAADGFERTRSSGWGPADLGGTWVLKGAAANFTVGGGVGSMNMAGAGSGPSATLNGVSSTKTDTTVTFSARKAPTGGGIFATVIGREVAAGGGYRASVNLRANGSVSVSAIRRLAAGVETAVKPAVIVTGLTYTVGEKLNVRFVVSGTSPTALKIKVWKTGTAEPAGWTVDTTDATADIQAAGTVGLMAFLSGTSTNAPVIVDFDDLAVKTAG